MWGFEKVPSGRDYWKEQEAKEKAFIENSLKNLKNMINNDPWITRQPRLEKWAAVFNYKYMWWDWEIVARKDINGKYSVRVKKLVRFPNWKEDWKTQKNGDKDTFNFDAKDKNTFNRYLWAALDRTIWKNRDRLPTTWWFVYNLLNKWNIISAEPQKVTPIIQQKTTPKEQQKIIPKNQSESKETKGMPRWLTLDHWTYVYTVQQWDCESIIKEKLERYAPLSYLKGVPDDIRWYNFTSIPNSKLLPWLKIPIPKKNSERIRDISDFKRSQRLALNEMKNSSEYWNQINKLIKQFWENRIINVMTAYAKSETCPEDYDNKVWKFALFRYEDYYKCPSYGYHHVLYMDAGWRAFQKTKISVWQSCSPKDSWKLFLAFCIEKSRNDYRKFFDLENKINLAWSARCYNWPKYKQNRYDTKLKKNYDIIKWIK